MIEDNATTSSSSNPTSKATTTENGINAQYDTEQLTYYYYSDYDNHNIEDNYSAINNNDDIIVLHHHHDDIDNDHHSPMNNNNNEKMIVSTNHNIINQDTKATLSNIRTIQGLLHKLDVDIYYATTTSGGNIVESNKYDDTGIMIWPATHLLCQCILFLMIPITNRVQSTNDINNDSKSLLVSILESLLTINPTRMLLSNDVEKMSSLLLTSSCQSNYNNSNKISEISYVLNDCMFLSSLQQMNFNEVLVQHSNSGNNNKSSSSTTTSILELGCGCGVVGVVIVKAIMNAIHDQHHQHHRWLYMSTDMSITALVLCQYNYQLNNIHYDMLSSSDNKSSQNNSNNNNSHDDNNRNNNIDVKVRSLLWDDPIHIKEIQEVLNDWYYKTTLNMNHSMNNNDSMIRRHEEFDMIIGADIVYPSTCYEVLDQLFRTVDKLLLKKNDTSNNDDDILISDNKNGIGGTFYLSFCTRDGYKTPIRLLQAATNANYAIISSMKLSSLLLKSNQLLLPPLLDSIVLVFQKHSNATFINSQIGISENCPIFPNLYKKRDHDIATKAAAASDKNQDTNQGWDDLPFGDSSSEDDER